MKGLVMRNAGLLVSILLICLVASSCTKVQEGPGPSVRVDDPRAPQATIQYNNVVFIDKSISRTLKQYDIFGWKIGPGQVTKIAVESQGARRASTNTLEVFATFRNRTDFPLQLEGRVQFFDADKFLIDGPTAWQRIYLPPNGVGAYKETSTRTNVAYYYTEVREGR